MLFFATLDLLINYDYKSPPLFLPITYLLIHNLMQRENTVTARPLKKGQNLLASNFVENVQDNLLPNGGYLLRSHVHHSMKKLVPLNVTVILSGQSGGIKKCSCSCKASECNRCAHVTALLLFLDDFVKKNGPSQPLQHLVHVYGIKEKRKIRTLTQSIRLAIHLANET